MSNASNKGAVAGRVVSAATAAGESSPRARARLVPVVPGSARPGEPSPYPQPRQAPRPVLQPAVPKLPGPTAPGDGADVADMGEAAARAGTEHGAEAACAHAMEGAGDAAAVDLEDAQRSLERRIRAHLSKGTLTVTLTDNRYTMISVRRDKEGGRQFKVRLHVMFADANPVITRALARYIAHNDREASRLLGEFIDANQHRVRSRTRRVATQRIVTHGRYHDLREIFDSLNERYFHNSIDARITWGQRVGSSRRRNSIKMGSYSVEDRLIRIHRSLDRAFVPRYFVEWIVYHEMLHQVHDIKVVNGRRQFHSREFLRDEAKFEHYAAARSWERTHLDALLTC